MSAALIEETIAAARTAQEAVDRADQKELALLINDLEEAEFTVFVKTAEARPLLERCRDAATALAAAVKEEGGLGEGARKSFSSFERAVSKLRNTILDQALTTCPIVIHKQ